MNDCPGDVFLSGVFVMNDPARNTDALLDSTKVTSPPLVARTWMYASSSSAGVANSRKVAGHVTTAMVHLCSLLSALMVKRLSIVKVLALMCAFFDLLAPEEALVGLGGPSMSSSSALQLSSLSLSLIEFSCADRDVARPRRRIGIRARRFMLACTGIAMLVIVPRAKSGAGMTRRCHRAILVGGSGGAPLPAAVDAVDSCTATLRQSSAVACLMTAEYVTSMVVGTGSAWMSSTRMS
mmetsp:Transcript_48876/g.72614  ORF Transcript_48876/g.72614 Transcript_48876/m.72614 type:complete len:238 (+) Transcript_48876:590-1303(+)